MLDLAPNELKEKLDNGEGVFLKLWQRGCGPCKLSEPATRRLEESGKYSLTFAQICIDDHPEMVETAGTDVLPVFFVFQEKQMKGKFAGFKGLKKLEEFVASSLA